MPTRDDGGGPVVTYRFSGHESFPCRYSWLPKAFAALRRDPFALADEQKAMVVLGVGKNMVRAIRFWVRVAGIAETSCDGSLSLTQFGTELLAGDGLDPFLEDIRTLWLLHWQISARVEEPLFAWDYMLNRWAKSDFDRVEVLRAFEREAERLQRPLSSVTLEQHLDVFLHTYVPTRSRKGEVLEDNLDCPLVELEFIQKVGERRRDGGRLEPVYAFRYESKPEITPQLFIFCLSVYWGSRRNQERTLTFKDIAMAQGSPGQIFKLPEWDIRERLEAIHADSDGLFSYEESAAFQRVTRHPLEERQLLREVYQQKEAYA